MGTGIFLLVGFTKFWFSRDEWDFIAHRGLRLANEGVFYPHNEHWTTIPIIVWRAIFNVVGVRDYWLYALPLILAHLATVYLLWRFMLRHQIDVWVATLLAIAFAVVGVGGENLTFAFQLTFVGSVAFGLLAIDAIETDRTWLAPLWCLCSLMCSDIGIPMIVACGFVVLVQRKPREAAIAVVPPTFIFLVWYAAIGHQGVTSGSALATGNVGGLPDYVWTGLTSSFSGFLDAPHFIGVLVVVVLIATAVVYRNAPAGLAASVLPLYGFIGLGRLQLGTNQATFSRYSYVAVALVLPLIGCLLTRLVRIAYLRPVAMVGLGLLVALNVVVLHRTQQDTQTFLAHSNQKTQMEAAAFLLDQGKSFPGQFPANGLCAVLFANEQCITEGDPDLSMLAAWVQKKQFPVPLHVPAGVLQAEQSVLNVSVSSAAKFHGRANSATPGLCTTIRAGAPLTVQSRSPISLPIYVVPSEHWAIANVAFPALDGARSTSTQVSLPTGSSWLNLPFGHFSSAVIASVDPIQVCQLKGSV